MAWTAPMTFTANTALTAAQLNTHLRDNLMETMLAKATTKTGMFWGTDTNELTERVAARARVETRESTTSTSFTDLATTGPAVWVETGTTAMIVTAVHMGNNTADQSSLMGYSIAGASSLPASDSRSVIIDGIPAATDFNYVSAVQYDMRDDLSPGLNYFKCEYRAGGGTAVYGNRFIAVWPM